MNRLVRPLISVTPHRRWTFLLVPYVLIYAGPLPTVGGVRDRTSGEPLDALRRAGKVTVRLAVRSGRFKLEMTNPGRRRRAGAYGRRARPAGHP